MLGSGPYADHIAIIIRQKILFSFLRLPLYIYVKSFDCVIKLDEPVMSIVLKSGSRSAWAPTYHAHNLLAILRTYKQIHAEAAHIVYTRTFQSPDTQAVSDFLMRIGSNRQFLRKLRSDTYASQSARMMFRLLAEAKQLEQLSFAHVSSTENPKTAVKNIWNDAAD
jgi:hypothetical protein